MLPYEMIESTEPIIVQNKVKVTSIIQNTQYEELEMANW